MDRLDLTEFKQFTSGTLEAAMAMLLVPASYVTLMMNNLFQQLIFPHNLLPVIN